MALNCLFCQDSGTVTLVDTLEIVRCPHCTTHESTLKPKSFDTTEPDDEVSKPSLVKAAEIRRDEGRLRLDIHGERFAETIDHFCSTVSMLNSLWEIDIHTGEPIEPDFPEMLMLTVSELSEALEGFRKDIPDTHLPHRSMMGAELADAAIRIFHIAKRFGIDLGPIIVEKSLYNVTRPDHQYEARIAKHGKKI